MKESSPPELTTSQPGGPGRCKGGLGGLEDRESLHAPRGSPQPPPPATNQEWYEADDTMVPTNLKGKSSTRCCTVKPQGSQVKNEDIKEEATSVDNLATSTNSSIKSLITNDTSTMLVGIKASILDYKSPNKLRHITYKRAGKTIQLPISSYLSKIRPKSVSDGSPVISNPGNESEIAANSFSEHDDCKADRKETSRVKVKEVKRKR